MQRSNEIIVSQKQIKSILCVFEAITETIDICGNDDY